TINNSGLLDLNGNNNTIGVGQLNALTMTGGTVTTGAGTLTLGGNVAGVASLTNLTPTSCSGNLSLGGVTRTLDVQASPFPGSINPGDPITSSGTLSSTGANFSSGNLTLQLSGSITPTSGNNLSFDTLNLGTGVLTLGGSSSLTLDLSGLTTSTGLPVPIIQD